MTDALLHFVSNLIPNGLNNYENCVFHWNMGDDDINSQNKFHGNIYNKKEKGVTVLQLPSESRD